MILEISMEKVFPVSSHQTAKTTEQQENVLRSVYIALVRISADSAIA